MQQCASELVGRKREEEGGGRRGSLDGGSISV